MSQAVIDALASSGWQVPPPFVLEMPDGDVVAFREVLRWLPGKRVSGRASWQGASVFAKLFLGESAARHARREQDGLALLQAAALPTPALLAALVPARNACLVISEMLPAARSLEQEIDDPEQWLPAFSLLGRLHAAGLVHDDLHPGNFLFSGERVLLIDGDGVRHDPAGRIDNLALMLSQMPVLLDRCRQRMLDAYALPCSPQSLAGLVDAWRERRCRRFLDKALRNCTQFVVDRDRRQFSVALRSQQARLAPLVADPDSAIASGRRLKSGATCTVAVVGHGAAGIVVKRYNLKNWRHTLSRLWRPSRAWHSWREAHRLAFHGIATPQPLAMREERWGALRGRAFLMTEYCPGPSLADCLRPDEVPEAGLAAALEGFFTALCRLHITHGDLKATNLLWHAGAIHAIDLDAMTQHRSQAAFRRAWRRDRARLLRNWPAGCRLHDWLAGILPQP